jgi:hypothetical protein
MSNYTTLFANIVSPLNRSGFQKLVNEYDGDRRVRKFLTWDLLRLGIYGQLSGTDSSRGIKSFLRANQNRLYHWGLKDVSLSQFCASLEKRDSRIFEKTAEQLVEQAGFLAAAKGKKFHHPLKIIDATTISISLKRYPWATYRTAKGGFKLHTRINGDMLYPEKIIFTDGKVADVKKMDALCDEKEVIYTFDRGYNDYKSLYRIHLNESTFVVRMKTNCLHEELCVFHETHKGAIRRDSDIIFTGKDAQKDYPFMLRKVVFYDEKKEKCYTYMTNNFDLSAEEIADVYKTRWQIELFFKWIKQHLKIKSFWGTSENAVMSQIWIAIITMLLLWIQHVSNLVEISLHQMMSLLKTTLFTKNTISGLLKSTSPPPIIPDFQLLLEDW